MTHAEDHPRSRTREHPETDLFMEGGDPSRAEPRRDPRDSAPRPTGHSRLDAPARYFEIVHALSMRDFRSRHRANRLGIVPVVAVPILMLAAYSFVFSSVIPVRLHPEASRTDYAFFLFSGLIAWNLFAETVLPASRIYVDRSHFVRKALFPPTALPASSAVSAFYRSLVWLAAFAVLSVLRGTPLSSSWLLAPMVLASVALFATAVAIALAAVGVFARDLAELIGPWITAVFFVSPVLVPSEHLSSIDPWLVHANPLAPALRSLHQILLSGIPPKTIWILAAWGWGVAAMVAAWVLHVWMRPRLGDMV